MIRSTWTWRRRTRAGRRASIRLVCELMESRELLSTYVVSKTSDSATCPNSLPWVILQVDADSTPDTIDFDIPGVSDQSIASIALTSALPAITNSVLIDGTSQPDYSGTPLIELDGSGAGSGADGLEISASGCTVEGLAIVGFSGSGIAISSSNNDVIQGNYLGSSPSSNGSDPNGEGISISGSSDNTIGGTASGQGNLISGNTTNGIDVNIVVGPSNGNEIVGNLIGTGPTGLTALGNGGAGILIAGASTTQIGVPSTNFSNVISGNVGPGIQATTAGPGTVIQNNAIGVGADGETVVGNGGDGILWDGGAGAFIGGDLVNAGNVIGGNQGNGIETLDGAGGLQIFGNFIGTGETGGLLDLGNRENGIQLATSSNYIGGTELGAGNTIDFNGSGQIGSGVQLVGTVNQNEILSNSIYENSGLGINLGNGPTPNHAPGTPGPNNYQNYPTLTSVLSDGSGTTITGSLYSIPDTTFVLQFFSNPTGDKTGFGQGESLIGSGVVQTNANGDATFAISIPNGTGAGSYVSATATDPAGNTSEFSEDVLAQPEINLMVSASATPSPVASGGQLTYTISVTNSGTLAATGVVISDLLPTEVTELTAYATAGIIEPSQGSGTVTVRVAELGTGDVVTLTIVVDLEPNYVGSITDSVAVSCEQTDPVPSALDASVTTLVEADADVAVALTASPSSVPAGGDLTDTITIANLGPEAATAVTATLPLAPGVIFVSDTPGVATVTTANGQVIASVGSMAANSQTTVTVIVEPTIVGTLIQTTTVTSNALDLNLSNNTSSATTQVTPAADLAVSISPSAASADVESSFQYVVSVTNNGPSDASGVVLLDTLPAGMTYVSALAAEGTITYSDGVVSLSIDSLSAGTTAAMAIVASPIAAPGTMLVDSASVSGQQPDPNSANNTATVSTPMVGVSDLGITATAEPDAVYVGQAVSYTLSVSNQGPNDEPDAVVTCPLSSDVVFASASYTPGWSPTLAQGVLTANLGPLTSGATANLTVVLVPQAAAAGTFTIGYTIQGQNADPDLTNNTAYATIAVTPAADLEVTIAPAVGPAAVQAEWTYNLRITNLGLSDSTGAVVTSPLPSGVQFVAASSTQGGMPAVLNGTLTADLGAIAAGNTAVVSVSVIPDAIETLSLSASVAGSQFDPDMANNSAIFTEPVAPSVNLAVALAASASTVVTGEPLTITASVENTGPNPATAVVLSLPMGASLRFDSAAATLGTTSVVGGQVVAQLGELEPGASAMISVVFTPVTPGTVTQSASATAQQNQLNPSNATATATVTVLESPGTLEFGAASYSVANTAGVAYLSVMRTLGSLGAVTVNYQTVAVDATPGLDFIPTSGTLTFAAGQTVGTIVVPVLNDPWENHNGTVNLVLSAPGGGATLGSLTTAQLNIIDTDPDTTPPEVASLTWSDAPKTITSVNLTFTAPLNPSFAGNPADYQLYSSAGQPIAISAVFYNPSTYTATLVPAAPLASNRFYQVEVVGTGATAVRDLAGNLLDGASNGLPASNYVASFGQGTKLSYVDQSGNKVSLKLSGGGYLQDVLYQGQGQTLTIIGEKPHRTVLSGTLKKKKHGIGTTNLGIIRGLGNFGDVRVTLKSPPFLVSQYPFEQNGRGKL